MKKHEGYTPGPWIVTEGNPEIVMASDYKANDQFIVAECLGPDDKANAKLIADAPMLAEQNDKMLAMLKKILFLQQHSITPYCGCTSCNSARDLIAEVEEG